jgi:outer membrane protein TolC
MMNDVQYQATRAEGNRMWVWVVAVGLAQAPSSEAPAPAEVVPEVTLDQALALAEKVASVRAAGQGRVAAEARLEQARDVRLPSVNLSGSISAWNGPHTLAFIPPEAGLDCAALAAEPDPAVAQLANLCFGLSQPLTVREQVTSQLTARVAEPITGQIAMGHRVDAAEAGLEAADAQVGSSKTEARFAAEDAFFLALQAEGQLSIAEAQVNSLQARVDAAQVAFQGGTVTRNDVLKAELALARAQQQVITARTLRDASRSRLGLAIGNGGAPVAPAGAPKDPPAPPAEPLEALVQRAIDARPDLVALRAQVKASDASASAVASDRVPQLNAIAAFVNTEGQGPFAEEFAGFVGANLDWTLWAWRARDRGVDAARAQAGQLRAQLEGAEAGVRVDVRTRLDALNASIEAWHVASTSIGQAEENLKIQDTLRAAGSGTMTDLLDAEAALVEARSRTDGALYDAHRAAAALQRALGGEGSR